MDISTDLDIEPQPETDLTMKDTLEILNDLGLKLMITKSNYKKMSIRQSPKPPSSPC